MMCSNSAMADGDLGDSCSMEDDYMASIELSNSCREFYHNHRKTTAAFKQSVRQSKTNRRTAVPSSRIDAAMDRLRSEMSDLMDQDLSLMEQLLTLNDKIEEVKYKYMYSASKNSLYASSCDFTGSEMSLVDDELYHGQDDDVIDHVTEARDSESSTPTDTAHVAGAENLSKADQK